MHGNNDPFTHKSLMKIYYMPALSQHIRNICPQGAYSLWVKLGIIYMELYIIYTNADCGEGFEREEPGVICENNNYILQVHCLTCIGLSVKLFWGLTFC